MSMTFIPAAEVVSAVRGAGGKIDFVETKETPHYQSSTYYVSCLGGGRRIQEAKVF